MHSGSESAKLPPIMPPTSYGPTTPEELEFIASAMEQVAGLLRGAAGQLRERGHSEIWCHQIASMHRMVEASRRFTPRLQDSLHRLATGVPYGPPDKESHDRPNES